MKKTHPNQIIYLPREGVLNVQRRRRGGELLFISHLVTFLVSILYNCLTSERKPEALE